MPFFSRDAQVSIEGLIPDLEIDYLAQSGAFSRRRITSTHIRRMKSGGIGLIARCHLRGEERCFELSSIRRLAVAGQPLVADIDLDAVLDPFKPRLDDLTRLIENKPAGGTVTDATKALVTIERPAIEDICTHAISIARPYLARAETLVGQMLISRLETSSDGEIICDFPAWFSALRPEITAHTLIREARHIRQVREHFDIIDRMLRRPFRIGIHMTEAHASAQVILPEGWTEAKTFLHADRAVAQTIPVMAE